MRIGWLALIALLCAPVAHAQFKWVDADGRVGYGDKPPAGAHDIEPLDGYLKGVRPDPLAQLPFGLQRTVRQFPVTLYTMANCPGCDTGRGMLKARAVPFSERTVASADDVQALKKLTGGDRVPAVAVGARILVGFNSADWEDALDLAGYPRAGQLPPDWKWPEPTPLAPPAPAQAAAPAPDAPAAGGNAPN